MANYQETEVAGSSYIRSNKVVISNGEAVKEITFFEEKLINLEGETLRKNAGQVSSAFSAENADTEFAILNPGTGEPIAGATMTYADVYAALYSLYLHLATARDEFEQAAADGLLPDEPAPEEPPAEEPAPAE